MKSLDVNKSKSTGYGLVSLKTLLILTETDLAVRLLLLLINENTTVLEYAYVAGEIEPLYEKYFHTSKF